LGSVGVGVQCHLSSSCRAERTGGLTLRTMLPYRARLVSMGQLCMARSTSCTHALCCKARTSCPKTRSLCAGIHTRLCLHVWTGAPLASIDMTRDHYFALPTSSPSTITNMAAETVPRCPACIPQGLADRYHGLRTWGRGVVYSVEIKSGRKKSSGARKRSCCTLQVTWAPCRGLQKLWLLVCFPGCASHFWNSCICPQHGIAVCSTKAR
jgi:hypothetical protein